MKRANKPKRLGQKSNSPRPSQVIAKELLVEKNTHRVLELSRELDEALQNERSAKRRE